jgi:hypothetical protein
VPRTRELRAPSSTASRRRLGISSLVCPPHASGVVNSDRLP